MPFVTDTFLVWDTADRFHSGAICHGAEEARDYLSGIKENKCSYRVLRITEGELCRDLSDEFLSDPEPVEEYPETFKRQQYMRRIGSYGW